MKLNDIVKQIQEDWWSKLEPDEQAAYIKAHPKSKKAQQAKQKAKDSEDSFDSEKPEDEPSPDKTGELSKYSIDDLEDLEGDQGDLVDDNNNYLGTDGYYPDDGEEPDLDDISVETDLETIKQKYIDLVAWQKENEYNYDIASTEDSDTEEYDYAIYKAGKDKKKLLRFMKLKTESYKVKTWRDWKLGDLI